MVCLLVSLILKMLIRSETVANLPAEIAHLLEEIQAKDRTVQECRSNINSRDSCLQKFLKVNGAGKLNPKEEAYAKSISASFDKAQAVQEEKVALSDKAAHLVRNHPRLREYSTICTDKKNSSTDK